MKRSRKTLRVIEGVPKVKFSPEDTPGVICIERRMQDDTVLISGTLKLGYNSVELDSWVNEAIKKADLDVKGKGGVMGQIKAALTKTSESVVTLTGDNLIENEAFRAFSRVSVAAVMIIDQPKDAENIIREALASIRAKARAQS